MIVGRDIGIAVEGSDGALHRLLVEVDGLLRLLHSQRTLVDSGLRGYALGGEVGIALLRTLLDHQRCLIGLELGRALSYRRRGAAQR